MADGATAVGHQRIYAEAHAYCAHPHLVTLASGDWLLVFNRTVRRSTILHPPQDPHYYNVICRSSDQGATWSTPQVVPGYDWHGVECAGLTVLPDDTVLLNQWRFAWFAEHQASQADDAPNRRTAHQLNAALAQSSELDAPYGEPPITWQRADGSAYVHVSADGGRTWQYGNKVETAPYAGGYGMRGGVTLSTGEVLLPLSDVPHYERVFIVRSADNGRSWSAPAPVAAVPGKAFEEPAPLRLSDDRILMLLRENVSGRLHQTMSEDGGRNWFEPTVLPFAGYPADLLALPDGRIMCIVAERRPAPRICAVLSNDQGRSWQDNELRVVRDGLRNADIGYPSSALRRDGSIYTAYYCQDEQGVTGIEATVHHV